MNTENHNEPADRSFIKLYNGTTRSRIPSHEDVYAWIESKPTSMKSYASIYTAHRIAQRLAEEVASIHETADPAMYTLIEFDSRFYPVIFVNELIARPEAVGGYVAHVASQGFGQA